MFPQPAGGDNGFVTVTADFSAYAQEIARKIQIETRTAGGMVEPIPTLGEWSIILLAALLVLVGSTALRRRFPG